MKYKIKRIRCPGRKTASLEFTYYAIWVIPPPKKKTIKIKNMYSQVQMWMSPKIRSSLASAN